MAEPEERHRDGSILFPVETAGPTGPALRVAIGLGDPDRERTLLPALSADGDIVVAERCLSADHLLRCLEAGDVDVALLADDLHRLADDVLTMVARSHVPLVVLSARPDDARWHRVSAQVLPFDAGPDLVRQALLAASRGERSLPILPRDDAPGRDVVLTEARVALPTELATIAVASGHGSPGRTLVALNLAAALGAVAPTVLVDADVSGPSVAAYLDLDPTRNLFMLAHAEPQSPRDWNRAIAEETQPLDPRSPYGVALCGIPKPEMRTGVSTRFFERLVGELRQRYRFVILDVGADLLGAEAALHRLALGASQQVLFVAAADLVGLWHARVGLGTLTRSLNLGDERVTLVINRHDRHYHHGRVEIEWTLGRPTAAIVPEDPAHVQKALLAQRPLVLDRQSRAGRRVLDLAERVHGGAIIVPPELSDRHRKGLIRRVVTLRPRWPFSGRRREKVRRLDEHDVAATL